LVAYGLGLASSIPDTTIGKLAKQHQRFFFFFFLALNMAIFTHLIFLKHILTMYRLLSNSNELERFWIPPARSLFSSSIFFLSSPYPSRTLPLYSSNPTPSLSLSFPFLLISPLLSDHTRT
jgi:hypothetical protein